MKPLARWWILLSILGLSLPLGALEVRPERTPLVFIDPKFGSPVPVYRLDPRGRPQGEPVTSLIPGEMMNLKEVRQDGWYVIRGQDLNGEAIDLAIDPKSVEVPGVGPALYRAAPNSRRITVGGQGPSVTTKTPALDPTVCQLDASLCSDVLPKDGIEVQDAVLALTLDSQSAKPRWQQFYKSQDGWWVESDATERVDASWSNIEDPKECDEAKPPGPLNSDQQGQMSDVAQAALQNANESQVETVLQHIGDCHSMDTRNYHDKIISTTAGKRLPPLTKEQRGANGQIEAVPATRADWVSIDILARTMYGEMASCFAKGTQYPETVAKVILNRVDFNQAHPRLGTRFLESDRGGGIRSDITNVIFKDKQFSVWNRDDAARRMAMCPPSSADRNYWKGSPPNQLEQDIWKEATRIATEAVLSGESFRARTADLKALYYTSNFELSAKHYDPITNGRINGRPVPLSRCVQLWGAKDLKQWAPDFGGLFHPWLQELLHETAGL